MLSPASLMQVSRYDTGSVERYNRYQGANGANSGRCKVMVASNVEREIYFKSIKVK